MPIAATKSNECLIAANKILNKYLAGETLSPFDSYSYEKLANDLKKVRPSDSLQLRGLIAMINDDDKAFYDFFSRSLLAAENIPLARANFASALATYGDYEKAEEELRLALNEPLSLIGSGCIDMCLYAAEVIENIDILNQIWELCHKFNINFKQLPTNIHWHLITFIPENNEDLFKMLDTLSGDLEASPTSEQTLTKIKALIEEIEADDND